MKERRGEEGHRGRERERILTGITMNLQINLGKLTAFQY